ncbi:MAG: class I SAM-dependent methyltransferase [Actinobacteria bacterium]|nr:class I SAM-dependent methyltransferase [Actinomycetota bacterium]
MTKDHKTLYDTEHISCDYAARDYMDPAEKTFIEEFGKKLADMDMLDMGVGGGRTTKYFAPLVKSYMGADYAASMISACQKKHGDRYKFIECDARNMDEIADNCFDFILFSYNGIDSFGNDDRMRALAEIRRVLRPGGIFFFSSHNLNWDGLYGLFSLGTKEGSYFSLKKPGKLLNLLKLRYLNKSFSMKRHIKKLRKKRAGHIYDNSLNGKAGIYYITAKEQIKQLHDAGFNIISTYSRSGIKTNDEEILNSGGWIYYLCS